MTLPEFRLSWQRAQLNHCAVVWQHIDVALGCGGVDRLILRPLRQGDIRWLS